MHLARQDAPHKGQWYIRSPPLPYVAVYLRERTGPSPDAYRTTALLIIWLNLPLQCHHPAAAVHAPRGSVGLYGMLFVPS